MTPRPATPAEADEALGLVVRQQQRPDRCITYLGIEHDGVVAELEEISPPWREGLRVLVEDGHVTGAVVPDVDRDTGRVWVLGPWVDTEDNATWDAAADALVAALRDDLPADVTDMEMCGYDGHELLAALAAREGLEAGQVNHAMLVPDEVVAGWEDVPTDVVVRPARTEDLSFVAPLHEAEFPSTHTSVERLLDAASEEGDLLLVAERRGTVVGYAAGQVHPDGEGYVDYLGVTPSARGAGVGRALMVTLVRQLAAAGSTGRVCLTVEDRRAPARALYDAIGFVSEGSILGHRTPIGDR